jgi:multicomponent Na+:H+ antiporter subunit D
VNWSAAMPLLMLGSSLVPAVLILVLPERMGVGRLVLNLGGAVVKVVLAFGLVIGVFAGQEYEWRAAFLPGVDLVLRVDAVPLLFAFLSALLWLTTTVYAIGYLRHDRHHPRFFGFFSCASPQPWASPWPAT